ncbi:MAG TPA: hypothetical protein VFC68_07115 [Treponemataceae bacterium]|nr:hypothetical protein [Treponemataceae bacterium]
MKKKILALCLVCSMCASALFALGIGLQGGTNVADNGQGSVDFTFKLNSQPFIFAVGIPSFEPLAIGFSADYWLVNDNIAGPVNYFVGCGGFGSIFIGSDVLGLSIGGRIPLGLNMFFAKNVFELYLQMAPGFKIKLTNGIRPSFVCPANFGFRVWI